MVKEEELIDKKRLKPKELSKKSVEAMERCYLLYEKGKLKNELLKIIQLKNHELDVKQDLASCTFRPRVNNNSLVRSLSNCKVVDNNTTIYERSVNKRKAKNQKASENLKNDKFTYVRHK